MCAWFSSQELVASIPLRVISKDPENAVYIFICHLKIISLTTKAKQELQNLDSFGSFMCTLTTGKENVITTGSPVLLKIPLPISLLSTSWHEITRLAGSRYIL